MTFLAADKPNISDAGFAIYIDETNLGNQRRQTRPPELRRRETIRGHRTAGKRPHKLKGSGTYFHRKSTTRDHEMMPYKFTVRGSGDRIQRAAIRTTEGPQ